MDVGEKRIGVAISDPTGVIASPLTTVEVQDEDDLALILSIVSEHGVERVVVGLPRSLDGGIGPQAQRVRVFVDRLRQATKVVINEWDERLSTVAAQRTLRAGGSSRAKQKARRDEIAATIILQSYLDRMRDRNEV